MKTTIYFVIATSISITSASSQGTFQDLDFENANIVVLGTGISAADAFPGWQTFIGTTPLSSVHLDGASAGGALVSLVNNDPSDGGVPIQGNYSVVLFGGELGPFLESVSISQTGTVPAGTESIQLDAANAFGPPFTVTLGGIPIDMVSFQNFAHYELWGGNIPAAMAGQAETLTITEPSGTTVSDQGIVELDDIVFSSNPITVTPEPSPFVLTAIGGVLFALYRRFAPK